MDRQQKVEWRLVVLLNDNVALDHELTGGQLESRDRDGVVFHIATPADTGRRRGAHVGRLDAELMALPRPQPQAMGSELHGCGEIIIRTVENLVTLHVVARSAYSAN